MQLLDGIEQSSQTISYSIWSRGNYEPYEPIWKEGSILFIFVVVDDTLFKFIVKSIQRCIANATPFNQELYKAT